MTTYEQVLLNLSEFVAREIQEGATPQDVMMALEMTKFSMMFISQRQAEAFNQIYGTQGIPIGKGNPFVEK